MKNYKNILFINYGGIGDEILFLPTLQTAKETFQNAKITLALEPRSKTIQNLTNIIDEIICIDIKAKGIKKYFNILYFIFTAWFKNFDCVISSGKSPLVAIILFLTGIKERIGYNSKTDFLLTKKAILNENQYAGKMYHNLIETISQIPYKNPNIEIPKELQTSLKTPENYIAIHPGVSKMSISKNIFKCPELIFWKSLIKALLDKNETILLLGTKDDKDIIEKILEDKNISEHKNFINYFNKTKNIIEMALIMKNAKKVICVDSAPLHVAVATKSNILAIFGPTNEKKLVPDSKNIEIATNKNITCRPCLWHKRTCNCQESKCLNIDTKEILDKIN